MSELVLVAALVAGHRAVLALAVARPLLLLARRAVVAAAGRRV